MLRWFRLGAQSLWIDEVFTWLAAGGGTHLGWRDLLENVHGPLYTLAVRASMDAFGDREWALRLPGAVAGILTVPAMAWLAWRWLGRAAAVPAAWLAACSPFLVWYSQEARNYAWLILGTSVSCAVLFELRDRFSAGGVARYLGASAVALLSNLSFALLVPLHLAAWLAGEPATRAARRRTFVLVLAGLALVASPWLPQIARTWDWRRLAPEHTGAGEAPLRAGTTFHVAAVPFALHAFAVGYSLGPSLRELRAHPGMATLQRHAPELVAVSLVFAVLAVAGIAALARRRRLTDTLLWLVAPALIVSYFAARNFKVFHPRYLAVSLPCWLLLLAAAFMDMGPRGRRVLGGGVAVLWAISLYQYYAVPEYGRENYRGALALVRAGWIPGEQVLAVGAEEPVLFYGRGLRVERFWLGYADQPGRLDRKLNEALSRARGTWVVLSRSEDLDPRDGFARTLDATYPHAGRGSWPGVRLWHLPGGEGNVSSAP